MNLMGNKKNSLEDRMKVFYENRTKYLLPRRTYTLIRIDGKAFHTYTKGFDRPFDLDLIKDMNETACYLCKNIQGAKFGYVQSDEISILLSDFEGIMTDAWFDGSIQKISSISASLATAKFNQLRLRQALLNQQTEFYKELEVDVTIAIEKGINTNKSRALQSLQRSFNEQPLAMFDSRVWTIPSSIEVENYFIWRQQDATRNSILSVAQTLYSHKEMANKNCNELQEMIFQKGINWNNYDLGLKNGRLIIKKDFIIKDDVIRTKWISIGAETFTQNREIISNLIPKI